jgi:hypothetical protein
MAPPTAQKIKSNIQAEDSRVWSEASQRPEGLDLFESDLAKAIAAAWADVESAFVIASVPVTGGSSGPGTPLQGGSALLAPGTLTNSASFTSIADKFSTSFPDGATEGLLALVDSVAQGIGQKFALWTPGYTATLTASGGSCAWISAPPPAPGPWSGGSIEAFPLGDGTSAGDAGMTAQSLEAAIGAAADPSQLKQNQNSLQPALAAFIQAIAKGFETTWGQWKSATKISGGTGTGVASPPSGTVVGAVASPLIG